jgi:hypothetical protein
MGHTLPPRVQLLDADLHGPPAVRLGTTRPLAREPLVQELVTPLIMQLPTTAGPPEDGLVVAQPAAGESGACRAGAGSGGLLYTA